MTCLLSFRLQHINIFGYRVQCMQSFAMSNHIYQPLRSGRI